MPFEFFDHTGLPASSNGTEIGLVRLKPSSFGHKSDGQNELATFGGFMIILLTVP
jgi:hypothetical protein